MKQREEIRYKTVTWRMIEEYCISIAEQITKKKIEIDIIIGIMRGGWIPAKLLLDYLGVNELASIEIKFYKGINVREKEPIIVTPLFQDIYGKNVLVVDDVADTGKTLAKAVEFLKYYGPRAITTATLFVKPWTTFWPDFYAEKTTAWIVFPWDKGETLEELYRSGMNTFEKLAEIIGDNVEFVKRVIRTRNINTAHSNHR